MGSISTVIVGRIIDGAINNDHEKVHSYSKKAIENLEQRKNEIADESKKEMLQREINIIKTSLYQLEPKNNVSLDYAKNQTVCDVCPHAIKRTFGMGLTPYDFVIGCKKGEDFKMREGTNHCGNQKYDSELDYDYNINRGK